jgi:hypothetical protein
MAGDVGNAALGATDVCLPRGRGSGPPEVSAGGPLASRWRRRGAAVPRHWRRGLEFLAPPPHDVTKAAKWRRGAHMADRPTR